MATTEQVADEQLRATLAAVAPGTDLRDGLDRILRGRTGALIVLGYDKTVETICSGGFTLDVEFSATRLRELCKMDGAVDHDRAVHLAQLAQPGRGELDVQGEPARADRLDGFVVPEHDERSSASTKDPIEAVAQIRAGRDRGKGRTQLLVSDLFRGGHGRILWGRAPPMVETYTS